MVNVWAETNERGEAILFAFDYPGACGWGPSWTDAVNRLSRDLRITHTWMVSHGLYCPSPVDEFHVVEIVPATGKPLECDSEGFFNWDNDSFEDGLLDETVKLLSFSRQDLLRLIDGVSDDVLDARLTQGKRTIREIVDHIAIAEWWYTTRLAADPSRARPWSEYGADVLSRLNEIRNMFLHEFVPMLRRMSDRERQQVFEHRGERWTAKKVLRRAVWHELLHLKQLYRLVPKVVSAVW